MKKVLWLALAGLSLARPALAAPTTVSLVGWGGPEERDIMQAVLKDFEASHPDVCVHYTQIPGVGYDYLNKVRLMIVAGMAPDVYYVPDGAFAEFAKRRTLLDLEPYVAKSKVIRLADIWPSSLMRYRWDGHHVQRGDLYCLPKDIGPNVMFYNKDLLRRRGVPFPDAKTPLTWAQAIADWKKLSYNEGNIQHYGISGFPYEDAVFSSGGRIISEDQRHWVLDDPVGVAAVQWCADLSLVLHVAPSASKTLSTSPTQLFESQMAAMHIDGRWMVPHYRKLPFDWDVAPVPVPKAGDKSVAWSGSVGFGISATSQHPGQAFELIEYLAGPTGQTKMTASGLQVPNQRWLAKTNVFLQRGQRPAHAEVFLDAALNSRPGPWTETPNTFWHDVFWNFVGKIWRGERPAKQYLHELSPMINQTLRENNEEN